MIFDFFVYGYGDHRDLPVLTHSFPTRRSSDLTFLPRWKSTGTRTDHDASCARSPVLGGMNVQSQAALAAVAPRRLRKRSIPRLLAQTLRSTRPTTTTSTAPCSPTLRNSYAVHCPPPRPASRRTRGGLLSTLDERRVGTDGDRQC